MALHSLKVWEKFLNVKRTFLNVRTQKTFSITPTIVFKTLSLRGCTFCSLLVACYLLLVARYFLLVARNFVLVACNFVLVVRNFVLVARYFVLVARYFLLVARQEILQDFF